jgi:hypothetical protein
MRRRILTVAVTMTLLLAGCAGTGTTLSIPGVGGKPSDEQRIAAILNDVHKGMEGKKVFKVLAHVSRAYQDMEGRDYDGVREYLASLMRGYRSIRITRTPPKILVQGDRARAVETFGTIAEPFEVQENPPINLQGTVLVYLQREAEGWKIVEWGALR